jgi:hypothetical protein
VLQRQAGAIALATQSDATIVRITNKDERRCSNSDRSSFVMNKLHFAVPVRVTGSFGNTIEEIYSVDQALDFLQEWPVGRQGPLYQAAFDACFGASVDVVSTEEACRAFSAFCRVSKIMARDMMAPSEVEAEGRGLPL